MAKDFGVTFEGFDKIIGQYNKLLGDGLKPIINKCLEVAPKEITPDIERDMQKHNRTGRTERSIDRNNDITWHGTEASIPVGFHIRKGGLASVFLMYGTARHYPGDTGSMHSAADDELREDIIGPNVEKRIAEKQKQIFDREITKALGGS